MDSIHLPGARGWDWQESHFGPPQSFWERSICPGVTHSFPAGFPEAHGILCGTTEAMTSHPGHNRKLKEKVGLKYNHLEINWV